MDPCLTELDESTSGTCARVAAVARELASPVQREVLLGGMARDPALRERLRRKLRAAVADIQGSRRGCAICGSDEVTCDATLWSSESEKACAHEHHAPCILECARTDTRCPTCRAPFAFVGVGSAMIATPYRRREAEEEAIVVACLVCGGAGGLLIECVRDGCVNLMHPACVDATAGFCPDCIAES